MAFPDRNYFVYRWKSFVALFVHTAAHSGISKGNKMQTIQITEQSMVLFLAYANDADNWGGTPCVGCNVGGSKEDRGNLTQLKKAGLIETWTDEGNTWIRFTKEGKQLAAENGIEI
jgi:hypothetical protein